MPQAKQVINGTWGEVWINGEYVSEVSALQAKVTLTKVDVNFSRDLWKRSKVTGIEGKGTLKLHHVSSRMAILMKDNIKKGKQTVCTIISKLADPDALGAERVVLKDVTFDELTVADWEVKKNVEETLPFTFSGYDFLDLIEPQ